MCEGGVSRIKVSHTDSNDFDDMLKANLLKDLTFRFVIWFCLACGAGYLAIYELNISSLDYLDRMSKSLTPILNIVGTISLIFCLFGLMLKDLEATMSKPWAVKMRGVPAGMVRRLAGDLTLWTLAAFATILTAFLFAVYDSEYSFDELIKFLKIAFLLIIVMVFIAAGNILVRRGSPTGLVKNVKNPVYIFLIYGLIFYGLVANLIFRV